MPPLEVFHRPDLYCRQRWRKVQHITNEFSVHGTRNLFTLSKKRQKWTTTKQNFRINDIVLLKEDAPRNQWPLYKIIEANTNE